MSAAPDRDGPAEIHPHALCESPHVGAGTRVGAFAHVRPGARIGGHCQIGDHVVIENDVVIGDRVTIEGGARIVDGVRIGDDARIGPDVTFSPHPPDNGHSGSLTPIVVGAGASIGAAAVVLPGLKIGAQAVVGAGAVVTHDVPPRAIVSGPPAGIVGYVDAQRRPGSASGARTPGAHASAVRGVHVQQMPLFEDLRGVLTVGQADADLPFVPQRYFLVFDVPGQDVRVEHAHRVCHQFLVCVHGSVAVVVDDGRTSEEIVLDRPDLGLHVPPMVWAVQYRYSSDAVLLVLASHAYDAADYIRDYDEFLALVDAAPLPPRPEA